MYWYVKEYDRHVMVVLKKLHYFLEYEAKLAKFREKLQKIQLCLCGSKKNIEIVHTKNSTKHNAIYTLLTW